MINVTNQDINLSLYYQHAQSALTGSDLLMTYSSVPNAADLSSGYLFIIRKIFTFLNLFIFSSKLNMLY